jgi:acetolactate decarboxylase
VTQFSVVNALMLGRYDGVTPIAEVLRNGDFGVGTLDHLDGEIIVLDGHVYQVRGDGKVLPVGDDRSTPFAVVTWFEPESTFTCPEVRSLSELDDRLNRALPQKNNFLAIRIDGRFDSIRLRSVFSQEAPYRPLTDAVKSQSEWTHQGLSGTLVGIRCPSWVGDLNVPGYHWHFLSNDHAIGGHVLDCRIRECRVSYDICGDWLVKLEESDTFDQMDLGKDVSRDLKRVESSRGEGGTSEDPKP